MSLDELEAKIIQIIKTNVFLKDATPDQIKEELTQRKDERISGMNYSPCTGEKIVCEYTMNDCQKTGKSCTLYLSKSDLERWITTLTSVLERVKENEQTRSI